MSEQDVQRRLEAVRLMGKIIATEKGREFFKKTGYESADPIVAVYENEGFGEVLSRIREFPPPVFIMMATKNSVLKVVGISSHEQKISSRCSSNCIPQMCDPASPIGMIFDLIEFTNPPPCCIKLKEWGDELCIVHSSLGGSKFALT